MRDWNNIPAVAVLLFFFKPCCCFPVRSSLFLLCFLMLANSFLCVRFPWSNLEISYILKIIYLGKLFVLYFWYKSFFIDVKLNLIPSCVKKVAMILIWLKISKYQPIGGPFQDLSTRQIHPKLNSKQIRKWQFHIVYSTLRENTNLWIVLVTYMLPPCHFLLYSSNKIGTLRKKLTGRVILILKS